MAQGKASFLTENDLVATFVSHIAAGSLSWLSSTYIREFDYVSGRTDVLSISSRNEIIAFEAKLSNWRKALHQAWRNTSFANHVYVVLPQDCVGAALKHREQFEELGVGLCAVAPQKISVLIDSVKADPVIPWLHHKAKQMLTRDDGCEYHSAASAASLQ